MKFSPLYFSLWLTILASLVSGNPSPLHSLIGSQPLQLRTTAPYFPQSPPSCPICEQNYPNINVCAQSAYVFANFSAAEIIANPGAYINIVKCACTPMFQSAYPQCVDCFTQTNQTDVLNIPNLPATVSGMNQLCSVANLLLGGGATVTTTTPSALSTGGALMRYVSTYRIVFTILGSIGVILLL